MTTSSLPPAFSDLSPFVQAWARPSPDERQRRRRISSPAELKAFYDTLLPRVQAILAEVDKYPIGQLPESLHALYFLALSLAEVAPHIELYGGSPGVPFAFEESRFVAAHGAQNTALGLPPTAALGS